MPVGAITQGRRREDVPFGDLPNDVQPGDYWRYLDREGDGPLVAAQSYLDGGNLTGGVWGISCPGTGWSIGTLMAHTVREHDDGTISVRPGDGSSNSILVSGHGRDSWHGYIEHGAWSEV